jgi:hypothetical protein
MLHTDTDTDTDTETERYFLMKQAWNWKDKVPKFRQG